MRKERKSAAPTVLPLDDKSPTKLYYLPELGGGGGEVILAMPERKRFFLWEVFPKIFRMKNSYIQNIPRCGCKPEAEER